MPVPALACAAGPVCWGAKPREEAQGPRSIRGAPGEGKAGRVNVSEPLMMPRDVEPGLMEAQPGSRAWPLEEAASGNRGKAVGCVNTAGLGV
jgi:hypothetical protein